MLDEQERNDFSRENSPTKFPDILTASDSESHQEPSSDFVRLSREERASRSLRERGRGRVRPAGEGKSRSLLLVQVILCAVLLAAALIIRMADRSAFVQIQQGYVKLMEEERFHWFDAANKKVEAFMEEVMDVFGGQQSQGPETSGVAYRPRQLGQGGKGGWFGVSVQREKSLQPPEGASFAPVTATASPLSPLAEMHITSAYGYRLHPITGALDFHTGIDLAAAKGTNIRAAYPGTVKEVGESAIYGNYIVLSHGNMETGYSHCESIVAREGVVVRQGETIAKVGSTGVSTGPHLHFDLRVDGTLVDPLWLLLGLSYYHGQESGAA